jgi:16S rRNA (uracil1498-N3)-methyltransferase
MRNTRVYTEQPLAKMLEERQLVRLEPMGSAHLIKVLRMRSGARVTLFNGDGFDYSAEIDAPKPEAAELRVILKHRNDAESPLKITLIQALCRGEKMDWVLEKATELGVHRIIPVQTERTEVQLDAERAGKRLAHWQRVVVSACEQCGRASLPEILPLLNLDARLASRLTAPWLSNGMQAGSAWVLEPGENLLTQRIAEFERAAPQTMEIAVGPEGGFSERDLAQFRAANFQTVSFGPRILRTETAGIAALAVLQSLWGDLK